MDVNHSVTSGESKATETAEEIINQLKDFIINQRNESEKNLNIEIKNHASTKIQFAIANENIRLQQEKLDEQEQKLIKQQENLDEQEQKRIKQQEKLDEQEQKLVKQQEKLDEQQNKIASQDTKIDDQSEQIKYLVGEIHQIQNKYRCHENNKWIMKIIILSTTLAGLIKLIKK